MAKTLELPDPVFDALQKAASDSGTTPADWIAAKLPQSPQEPSQRYQSLAEALEGLIGTVRSGGKERLSENCGEKFTDYLVQKKREGRL